MKPQRLKLTPSVTQKDEQKVIFTISFLIKASAGAPGAGPDNANSSCTVQQQSKVRENHTLLCFSLVYLFPGT